MLRAYKKDLIHMRIAIDMQGALTNGSRPRGIGRYTTQLVSAMTNLRGDHDLTLMLNANHALAADAVTLEYATRLPRGAVTLYRVPRTMDYDSPSQAPLRQMGDAIVRRHVARLRPDVMLATSLFEAAPGDFSPPDLSRYPARMTAAILYDFIPLLFHDLYLTHKPAEVVYRATAESLRHVDLLLAISESAKRDAVMLLGIDPARVVNISGAADDRFRQVKMTDDERATLLAHVGISRSFAMYVSGADPRKNLKGAVAIFAALPPEMRQAHQLLLVTSLPPQGAAALRAHGESLGMEPDGLVIACGLDDESLVRLFNLCVSFIFPSLYEGFGLPVLEAMQCGAPVLAANNSSIPEIVNRSDILFDVSDTAAAAAVLARVLGDKALRQELSEWGLHRASNFNWSRSAILAFAAIEERLLTQNAMPPRTLPCQLLELDGARAELAQIMAPVPEYDPDIPGVVDDLLFSVPEFQENGSRRLLIDVTMTQGTDSWTGIQQVVRRLTAEFYKQDIVYGVVPVAVRLEPDTAITVPEFVGATLGCAPVGTAYPLEVRFGDDLFMLDSSWEQYLQFQPLFRQVRQHGGRIITCVYGLIPELHPDVCNTGVPEVHARWLQAAVEQSHGLICVSRTVADELITYIQTRNISHCEGLRIGWFHCGSDIVRAHSGLLPQPQTVVAFGQRPVFVSVGTLEPRREQALVLDAFEALWARGVDAGLCLIGKPGWKVEGLEKQLRGHTEFGRRLHWLTEAQDADVLYAYNNAEAVLCTSMAEGFGLPNAEAGLMNKPVICSDTPMFREVGGDGAVYFACSDAAALADTLENWLAGQLSATPSKVSPNSWADAALRIRKVLYDGDWYQRLD